MVAIQNADHRFRDLCPNGYKISMILLRLLVLLFFTSYSQAQWSQQHFSNIKKQCIKASTQKILKRSTNIQQIQQVIENIGATNSTANSIKEKFELLNILEFEEVIQQTGGVQNHPVYIDFYCRCKANAIVLDYSEENAEGNISAIFSRFDASMKNIKCMQQATKEANRHTGFQ